MCMIKGMVEIVDIIILKIKEDQVLTPVGPRALCYMRLRIGCETQCTVFD